MPAEEKKHMIRLSDEIRRQVVRAYIQDGRTTASLEAEYGACPEPLFLAGYARITMNSKTMKRRSLSWR